MTKDRIKDLQRNYRNHELQSAVNDGSIPLTIIDVDSDHSVTEFLAQIDLVRILIDKIEELTKDVEHIHRKMLEPMADQKLAQEVDEKTADIKKLAYDISTKLKKMEQIQRDQNDSDKASAQWRIKELQIFNLTRRFREVMNQYNLESVTHRDRCKKSIMREFEITGNKKTNDEIEDMLETGFPGTFSFSIMVDVEKAKQAASEIEARHGDIIKLEKSIKELHEMFADLARLVINQGQMIDSIEHNVLTASKHVGDATNNVKKTVEIRKNTRKTTICICIIIVAIVIVLLILISSYFIIQQKIIGR